MKIRYRTDLLAYPITLMFSMLFAWFLAKNNLLNPQGTMVIVAGLGVFASLFGSDASRWLLFCAAIFTVVFGHRGVYIGRWTFFIPLQVIIWLLFARSVVHAVVQRKPVNVHVPPALTLLTGWAVLNAGILLWKGQDWDTIISGVSGFILGYPTFWVVQSYVTRWERLKAVLDIVLVVCLLMAVLGIFEYYFRSQATSLFPWFFRSTTIVTPEGFERAGFNFWGYPAAASIIAWGIIIGFHTVTGNYGTSRRSRLAVLTIVCGLIAVYISGQRSTWMGLSLGLAFLGLFSGPKGWIVAAV
ncbi:MAG: hypothetical protein H5T63_05040, partial [Chloroflexi bacterium]|nr:hypothetical protein [Chloroflexota bacterium]